MPQDTQKYDPAFLQAVAHVLVRVTHGRCALVSITKHDHRQFLSADHFHHGLLARDELPAAATSGLVFALSCVMIALTVREEPRWMRKQE
jgi:hypothetical protein